MLNNHFLILSELYKSMQSLLHNIQGYTIPFTATGMVRLHLNEGVGVCETSSGLYNEYNSNLKLYSSAYKSLSEYLAVPQENLLITNGSSEAIRLVLHTLYFCTDESVKVVTESCSYDFTLTMMKSYKMTITQSDDIQSEISDHKTHAVYIVSPHNPLGFSRERSVVEQLLKDHPDTLFIIDEAYVEFSPNPSCADLTMNFPNLVVVRTFSKAHRAAGLRIGYLVSHPANVCSFSAFMNPLSVTRDAFENIPILLNGSTGYIEMIKENLYVFQNSCKLLSDVRVHTSHANFVYIEMPRREELFHSFQEQRILVRKKLSGLRITISDLSTMGRVFDVLLRHSRRDEDKQPNGIILAAGASSRYRSTMGTDQSKCVALTISN